MSTFTAFYDLAVGPVSFDFVVFLTKARMAMARAAGAKRLHVVVVPDPSGPGGFRDKRPYFDEHEARWRLHNIVLPACALAGASVTLATDWPHACAVKKHFAQQSGREDWVYPDDWNEQSLKNRRHLVGDVINWAKRGEAVPRLNASEHARRKVREFFARFKRPIVTMTTRSTYLPARNSDMTAWRAAEEHIESRGFRSYFICDTTHALRSGSGYSELNLDIRMACYQEAVLNLQSNNGAASLCWFSDVPYRMFGAGDEHWDGLFVKQGLALGATWPWAGAQQKICYGPVTAEAIIKEFDAWAMATS